MLVTSLIFALALATDDPCALPRGRHVNACSERVGHCFDMDIDGQRVQPLADAAMRARLTAQAGGSKPVCWELPKPTAGNIDIVLHSNAYTSQLGDLRKGYEVVVTGLDGQKVPTHKGLRSDPTVLIGGLPMQTAVDVIDTKQLPAGAYIVRVRVVGSQGYEDKSVYLHVVHTPDGNGR
ncbi:MAG: hypothetical protein WBV39_13365 [Rudaea sp.]